MNSSENVDKAWHTSERWIISIFRFLLFSNISAREKEGLSIHIHTFRHWHGTMEYHKTHNLEHVQKRLDYKNVKNTMIYIRCEETYFGQGSDEYIIEVTNNK